jgi:hypothetical protein
MREQLTEERQLINGLNLKIELQNQQFEQMRDHKKV